MVVTANGSSNYIIDGVAQPTLTFIPGNTYRFDVSDDSNGSHPLRFTESDGGTDYYTTGLTVNGTQGSSGAWVQLAVTQNTPNPLYYRCTAHGGMGNSITVDKTSPLVLDGNTGQISGSRFLFTGGKISGSSVEMDVENVTISGSSVNIQTPKFYLGETGQYISGSNGNIEISSSAFHLTRDGNVTMSGSITANDGEVGGFTINSTEISASGLLLKSSGQITASAADLSGKITADSGEIAGFNIIRDNAQSAKLISETSDPNHTSRMILSPATGSHKTGIFRLESIGAAGEDFENQAQIFDVVHPKSGFAGDPQTLTMASVINNLQLDGLSSGLVNYTYNKISGSYIQFENNSNVTSSKMSIVAQTNNKSSKMIIESGATKNVLTGIGGLQEGNGVLNQPFSRLYVDGYTNAQSSSLASFDNQNSVGVVIDIVRRSDGSRMPGFFVGRRDKAFIFLNGRPSAEELHISSSNFHLNGADGSVTMQGKVTATSGQIATFSITSGSIDSNTSNAKRGLKLEPGNSIRGYGNTVHTTETVPGKFSFGVGTISPAADSPAPFSNDLAAAPGGKFSTN